MQHIIDVGGSILAWAVVLLRMKEAFNNKRVFKAWRFALAFALFGTFHIDGVHRAFDARVGINNLAWLSSCVFGALSIYFLCATCCDQMPPWAGHLTIPTLALIIATFPFGAARAPESTYHVVPHNLGEWILMGTFYTYGATMIALIPFRAIVRAYRNERDLSLRLRSLVGLVAGGAILTFCVTKFAISMFTFIVPSLRPLAGSANTVANLPVLIMAFLWPLLFAPNRIYVIPARFIRFLGKVLTLMRLRALGDRLCATRSSKQGWIDQLRDLDFYICQEVIKILDDIRMLAASDLPEDDPALNLALRLRRALQGANPSSDPATAYWELSQLLRRAA